MKDLLHRIAEYFREWDGSEPAPTMQVHIDDLRLIAQMNSELCTLREERRNGRWIPCSVAVPANTDPKYYDAIAIKRANGEIVEGCCWSDRPIWWGGRDGKYFEIIDAVAWKPTVPYKGVE